MSAPHSSGSAGSDDSFVLLVIGTIALMLFGPPLAAKLVPQVGAFLTEVHVFTTESVILPIASDAGLDLARILVAVGLLLLLAITAVWASRRAAAARAAKTGAR